MKTGRSCCHPSSLILHCLVDDSRSTSSRPRPPVCGYLPDQQWSLQYDFVAPGVRGGVPGAPASRLAAVRPRLLPSGLPELPACLSLRVPCAAFSPTAASGGPARANADVDAGHRRAGRDRGEAPPVRPVPRFQSEDKGWPAQDPKDPSEYAESFVDNPFPTEEWCYYLGDRLVGVGYVDVLPEGLSAIYFYYDPNERDRSLGTFNVLRVIDSAAARGIPHVYLGYYVEGCRSLEYKARFRPNEVLTPGGLWVPFRS